MASPTPWTWVWVEQHFKQLVDELMVKGVGVVDRALREAFQILQQV